jgi:hypothetical protein
VVSTKGTTRRVRPGHSLCGSARTRSAYGLLCGGSPVNGRCSGGGAHAAGATTQGSGGGGGLIARRVNDQVIT